MQQMVLRIGYISYINFINAFLTMQIKHSSDSYRCNVQVGPI